MVDAGAVNSTTIQFAVSLKSKTGGNTSTMSSSSSSTSATATHIIYALDFDGVLVDSANEVSVRRIQESPHLGEAFAVVT